MSYKTLSKNEENWIKLFDEYNILTEIEKHKFFKITSEQINKYRESRLMTKFDHKSNLPGLFRENKLSILPITRGSYLIGKFDAYKNIEFNKNIKNKQINFPNRIKSIDPSNIYSEAIALNCAYLCDIIKDLINEEVKPTISGRMSTSDFDFYIKDSCSNEKIKVVVRNSQCEIDGGFESKDKLILIEAKNFSPDDFLIRQLYYPFRLWKSKLQKEIIPVFMTYSNDVFNFYIYDFENYLEYNSLKLIEQKNYIIKSEIITLSDIKEIVNTTKIIEEPKIPFPQADSFERVIDLLGLLMEEDLTAEVITNNYDFTKRQTDYYANACRYLGLIDKKKYNNTVLYYISDMGKKIMLKPHKEKYLLLVESILVHRIFNESLKFRIKKQIPLSKEDIYKIMKNFPIYKVEKDSTYYRRAQTVSKWIEWILELPNKFDK